MMKARSKAFGRSTGTGADANVFKLNLSYNERWCRQSYWLQAENDPVISRQLANSEQRETLKTQNTYQVFTKISNLCHKVQVRA
jgi:hypothetical protein